MVKEHGAHLLRGVAALVVAIVLSAPPARADNQPPATCPSGYEDQMPPPKTAPQCVPADDSTFTTTRAEEPAAVGAPGGVTTSQPVPAGAAPVAESRSQPPVAPMSQRVNVDCGDFTVQEDAQAVLDRDRSDPNGLDADNDGIACEELPRRGGAVGGVVPGASTALTTTTTATALPTTTTATTTTTRPQAATTTTTRPPGRAIADTGSGHTPELAQVALGVFAVGLVLLRVARPGP